MDTFTAVVTTGIYCAPTCTGRPRQDHITTFAYAAAAEAAGYRACLRCRPYRTPQPVTSPGSALVCRAVRLILGGALDDDTEPGLAARLGVSARQLRRLFQHEIGVTPTALARSSRAHFARRLLDDTDLTITEIAFAAGFGSVRQLNRTFEVLFRSTPSRLRAKRRIADRLVADGGLALRLSYLGPLDWDAMAARLAETAVPGVEDVDASVYRRVVVVDGDPGVLELGPGGPDHLRLVAHLPHWEGLLHVVSRARGIANLDVAAAEPAEVTRSAGTWDPFEVGIRALVARAEDPARVTGLMAALAARHGTSVDGLGAMRLTHAFPSPRTLAEADLTGLGLAEAQRLAVRRFARAVVDGDVRLDHSVEPDALGYSIATIDGIGPDVADRVLASMLTGEGRTLPAGCR